MNIVFFSNHLNLHQLPIADELYKLTGGNFCFVETRPMTISAMKGGKVDFSNRPYLIQAWKSEKCYLEAKSLAINSNVAVFGAESLEYEILRMKTSQRLAFEMSERWLKRGWINLFSPRLLQYQWYYHTLFHNKPLYKLCSSAFAAGDQYRMYSFRNRCFKWGYFTNVDADFDFKTLKQKEISRKEKIHFMWCARFLTWKHLELPVLLAERLKSGGYCFQIDMYGEGEMLETAKMLAQKLNVDDVVHFWGNVPNGQVLEQMRKHDIFLFTSDRNEGWGAVANESMSNGCALVGSDAIGSVPFLIKHRETGCQFQSQNIVSLEKETRWLLDNPIEINRIQHNAVKLMQEVWSPSKAAHSLLQLINDLENGNTISIDKGPCSKAELF